MAKEVSDLSSDLQHHVKSWAHASDPSAGDVAARGSSGLVGQPDLTGELRVQ